MGGRDDKGSEGCIAGGRVSKTFDLMMGVVEVASTEITIVRGDEGGGGLCRVMRWRTTRVAAALGCEEGGGLEIGHLPVFRPGQR